MFITFINKLCCFYFICPNNQRMVVITTLAWFPSKVSNCDFYYWDKKNWRYSLIAATVCIQIEYRALACMFQKITIQCLKRIYYRLLKIKKPTINDFLSLKKNWRVLKKVTTFSWLSLNITKYVAIWNLPTECSSVVSLGKEKKRLLCFKAFIISDSIHSFNYNLKLQNQKINC